MDQKLIEDLNRLLEEDPDWFKKCHKNEGVSILCICDKCTEELRKIIGENNG